MPKRDPLSILAALKADAEGLRAAGILEVELGGVRVVLAPPAPAAFVVGDRTEDAPKDDDVPEEAPVSALDDPDTFPGRRVPKRRRPEKGGGA